MHFSTSAVLLVSSLLAGTTVSAFSGYNAGSRDLYARYAEPEPDYYSSGLDPRSAYAYADDDDLSLYARDAEADAEADYEDYGLLSAREALVDDVLDALHRRDLLVAREPGLGDALKKVKEKIKPKPKPNYTPDVQSELDAFGKKDRSKTNDLNEYINEQQRKNREGSKKSSRKGKRSVDDELGMYY